MQIITETQPDARGVVKQLDQSRYITFKTDALAGGGKLFGLPVHGPSATSANAKLLNDSIAAVGKFDAQLADMNLKKKNGAISDRDLQSWRSGEAANRQTELLAALGKVQAAQQRTQEARTKILTVPPIPANDITTAISDNEVRQAMRTMSADQTQRIYAEIGAGKHQHVLTALARDPVPGSALGMSGRALFEAQMMTAHVADLAALDASDESHDAIAASLRELQKLIAG